MNLTCSDYSPMSFLKVPKIKHFISSGPDFVLLHLLGRFGLEWLIVQHLHYPVDMPLQHCPRRPLRGQFMDIADT